MTREQAVNDAVARGAASVDAAQSQPKVELSVMSYADYLATRDDTVANQVPKDASVYLVHVFSPLAGEWLPRPAGAEQPKDWPTYLVAYDVRTGLALAVSPGGDTP